MRKTLFVFAFFLFALSANAEKITVFVASSASNALKEVKDEFLKTRKNDDIELVFGASGKHYQLLKEGREFDMFFSADTAYAEQIYKDSLALTRPAVYALGVVALYSLDKHLIKDGISSLAKQGQKIKHLSIANPKVAPYGVAATEALEKTKIYDVFKNKIVLGDNISQPVIHVDTGVAEVGIVAYSLVSAVNKPKGKALVIDNSLFSPLEQSFVITSYAKGTKKDLALAFYDFVLSDKGKEIIKKYGFNTK